MIPQELPQFEATLNEEIDSQKREANRLGKKICDTIGETLRQALLDAALIAPPPHLLPIDEDTAEDIENLWQIYEDTKRKVENLEAIRLGGVALFTNARTELMRNHVGLPELYELEGNVQVR